MAPLADNCVVDGYEVRLADLSDNEPPYVGERWVSDSTPMTVLRIDAVKTGGPSYLWCPVDHDLLWSTDGYHYKFHPPYLAVARQAREGDSFARRLRDCVTVWYPVGPSEDVAAIGADVTEQRAPGPGLRSWASCGRAEDAHAIEEYGVWSYWEENGLRTLTVIDVDSEGARDRNLFFGGLGLGLAGAFLVEAFGMTIVIVEGLSIPGRSRRLLGRAISALRRTGFRRAPWRSEDEQLTLW